jgi:YD repeat-containing protein
MEALLQVKNSILLLAFAVLASIKTFSQTYAPVVSDQGLFNPSPDARGGDVSNGTFVSVSSGAPAFNIPIYELKCGALSLPVSLAYSYEGFRSLDDANWAGLGWNLEAGGMINRLTQGYVDGSQAAGYNYGEYSIHDSLFQADNSRFMNIVYAHASNTGYDVAPDIFDANFNGYSAKFYWYGGRQYMLSYNKEFKVDWPGTSSPITITTGDGTSYVFGQYQLADVHIPSYGSQANYLSAWYLTSVISADKKDSILLNYNVYSWFQPSGYYGNYYVQGTYEEFAFTDSVSAIMEVPLLQSITCRTARVNFIPDGTARTDMQGNMPSLHEIDVIDSVTGNTIKKTVFNYGYFNDTSSSQKNFERLKLKHLQIVDPSGATNPQSYTFSYLAEYNTDFPSKTDLHLDTWGFYSRPSEGEFFAFDDRYRYVDFASSSYAALDTVVYPSGGYTTWQYELNDYDSSASQHFAPGPGIRVKAVLQFLSGSGIPATRKTYSYLADNGTASSGAITCQQMVPGPIYIRDTFNFNRYILSNNQPGYGILNDVFHYGKVSEQSSAGNEKHRTDYYFSSFSNVFRDVELSKRIVYRYDSVTALFKPLTIMTSDYDTTSDTSFLSVNAYIDSSYVLSYDQYTLRYKYGYAYNYNNTYWKRIAGQKLVKYDVLNDSSTDITAFNYNSARNMDSVVQTLSDGRTVIQKLKYPDDYVGGITGNMVAANIIRPVVEKQTWLRDGASSANMISGTITAFDQTNFMPVRMYSLEVAVPLGTLNNETLSGGKYAYLISDTTNYVLKEQISYDANDNIAQDNKTNNVNTAFIWDYHHSVPVATISNAGAAQVAYTSFECDNGGNWILSDTAKYLSGGLTGNQAYNLATGKSISAYPLQGYNYIVSYWSQNGAVTVSANGIPVPVAFTGPVKNGWTYYEHVLPSTTYSVLLTAIANVIDELRLFPSNAQMITYTYTPLIGKSSTCDVDNRVSYYTYDSMGRLICVKDQDGNIVKTMEYHFNGQ